MPESMLSSLCLHLSYWYPINHAMVFGLPKILASFYASYMFSCPLTSLKVLGCYVALKCKYFEMCCKWQVMVRSQLFTYLISQQEIFQQFLNKNIGWCQCLVTLFLIFTFLTDRRYEHSWETCHMTTASLPPGESQYGLLKLP